MKYQGAKENSDITKKLFERLNREFFPISQAIIQVIAEEAGGIRLSMPDIATLHRWEEESAIRRYFNGSNIQELSLRFKRHPRTIRRILAKK